MGQERVVASTEGNHGRAVARVASWLGLTATILIPVEAGEQKIEAIRKEGAAGLAGLLALWQGGSHGGAAERLCIDRNARVLVLCTESAG